MSTTKELQIKYLQAKTDRDQAINKLKQVRADRGVLQQKLPELQEKLESLKPLEKDLMRRLVIGDATQKDIDDLAAKINAVKDEISKSKKMKSAYQEGESILVDRLRDAEVVLKQKRDEYTSSEALSRAKEIITPKILKGIQNAFAPWAADNGSWDSFLDTVLPMPDDNALSASVSVFQKNL